MHKPAYYLINAITFYRLAAAPLLLLLLVYHRPDAFKWMLAISFLTDAVDGYLSRRYKVASALGSRLDSIADDLTVAVAIAGIYVFRPAFFMHEFFLIVLLFTLYLLQNVLSLIRYGKTTSFHTYLAKVAAVLQAIFLLSFYFLPAAVYTLFHFAAIVTAFDLAEEIILVLLLPHWRADVRGLYWLSKKGKQPGCN